MTYAEATKYWLALSPEQKQMFYDIASKSEGNHTAFEWFMHLVPDELKDDPSEVEVWMQGGTVTTADGDVHEIPDRDVSRIESGANGGEYTTENTIMEDSSVNRSRGADNMTESEYQQAEVSNASDVEIIDGSTPVESTDIVVSTADNGTIVAESLAESALEVVGDIFTGLAATEAAMTCRKHFYNDMDPLHRDVATVVTGGLAWILYDANPVFMLGRFTWKVASKMARKSAQQTALPPAR